MDEAEKCTDLAYINLGKLLYSGPTKNLIPFSKVKTYEIDANRETLNRLNQQIAEAYPALLVAMVNNELRVSSRPKKQLDEFLHAYHQDSLTEVTPSFEEVFIGLMQ